MIVIFWLMLLSLINFLIYLIFVALKDGWFRVKNDWLLSYKKKILRENEDVNQMTWFDWVRFSNGKYNLFQSDTRFQKKFLVYKNKNPKSAPVVKNGRLFTNLLLEQEEQQRKIMRDHVNEHDNDENVNKIFVEYINNSYIPSYWIFVLLNIVGFVIFSFGFLYFVFIEGQGGTKDLLYGPWDLYGDTTILFLILFQITLLISEISFHISNGNINWIIASLILKMFLFGFLITLMVLVILQSSWVTFAVLIVLLTLHLITSLLYLGVFRQITFLKEVHSSEESDDDEDY